MSFKGKKHLAKSGSPRNGLLTEIVFLPIAHRIIGKNTKDQGLLVEHLPRLLYRGGILGECSTQHNGHLLLPLLQKGGKRRYYMSRVYLCILY